MADPKTYPALEDLLGSDAEPEHRDEPESEHAGARLWVMFLNRK